MGGPQRTSPPSFPHPSSDSSGDDSDNGGGFETLPATQSPRMDDVDEDSEYPQGDGLRRPAVPPLQGRSSDGELTDDEDGERSSQASGEGGIPPPFNSKRHMPLRPVTPLEEEVDQLGDDEGVQAAVLPAPRPFVPKFKGRADMDQSLADAAASLESVPASAGVAAVAASPAAPAASTPLEPEDLTVDRFDFILQNVTAQVQAARLNDSLAVSSPPFERLGFKWQLDVYPIRYDDYDRSKVSVGVYLHMLGPADGAPTRWANTPPIRFSIIAMGTELIKGAAERNAPVHSFDERNAEESCESHVFAPDGNWGFAHLVRHKRLDHFLYNDQAWFRVLLEVPQRSSVLRERKLASFLPDRTSPGAQMLQWPYAGLRNQGATCYMNSYLQTLFHLPDFRRRVFEIPVDMQALLELVEPPQAGSVALPAAAAAGRNNVSPSPSPTAAKTSIPIALQHLFRCLQTAGGDRAVSTSVLTKSFGWDGAEAWRQHDVQEFSRVLLDSLDESLAQCVPKQPPLTALFEGQQQMFIECTSVPFASTRVESFLDLSLNVKGAVTLAGSFKEYVAVERMEGANKYSAKDAARGIDHGMQDARKGIRFLRFPKVLQLQLKRFDFSTGEAKKLDERLEYPARLDLRELEHGELADPNDPKSFRPPSADDPAIYHLHSVLVHKGVLGGGHYYAFIRPFLRANAQAPLAEGDAPGDAAVRAYEHSPWFKFDDGDVSLCADGEQALARSFGGGYMERTKRFGRDIEEARHSGASAYMLMYVREKMVRTLGLDGEAAPPQQNGVHAGDASASAAANGVAAAKDEAVKIEPMETKEQPALEGDGDASMAATEPGAASFSAPVPLPPSHASTCFTADPPDVAAFIEALQPVSVPFPPRMEAGLLAARQAREKRLEQAAIEAARYRVDVIFEKDLLWQGLRTDEAAGDAVPMAGPAGLEFTVAPACDTSAPGAPSLLPLREFLFRRPVKSFVFQRSDTLLTTRARLAEAYGVPAERLQLWKIERGPPAHPPLRLHERRCTLTLYDGWRKGLDQLAPQQVGGLPLQLLVRDQGWIDHQPSLQALTDKSGYLPDAAASAAPCSNLRATQLERERLLVFFKYFDPRAQRMVHLGSALLHPHMNLAEVKSFLQALLPAKGIELRRQTQRPLTKVQRFEELEAASAGGDVAMSDGAGAGASGEAVALPVPELPHFTHTEKPSDPAAAGSGDADVEVLKVSESSPDEQRLTEWRRRRDAAAAAKGEQSGLSGEQATVLEETFFAPRLRLHEEAQCVWKELDAPLYPSPSSALTHAYQLQDTRTNALQKDADFAASQAALLQDDQTPLRKCVCNGSVLIVAQEELAQDRLAAQRAHAEALQRHRQQQSAAADAAQPMETDDASAASHAAPAKRPAAKSARRQKRAASPSASAAVVGVCSPEPEPSTTDAASASSLPKRALFAHLPPTPSFHASAAAYVAYLMRRLLVEFKPLVLDTATFLRAAADPANPAHAAHPLAAHAAQSIVAEVACDEGVRDIRRHIVSQLQAALPAATLAAYPQLADPDCFKLWRPSVVNAGEPATVHGDCTQSGQRTVSDVVSSIKAHVFQADLSNRAQLHPLLFELSAFPLAQLQRHWAVPMQLVDERGQVHRLPSPWPALCESELVLVPKQLDDKPSLSVVQLHQFVFERFIARQRDRLGLERFELLGADGRPLRVAEDVSADAAVGEKRAAEPAADDAGEPSAKRPRGECAADVSSAPAPAAAPKTSVNASNLRVCVYVPDASPLTLPKRPTWDPPSAAPPPAYPAMAHFLDELRGGDANVAFLKHIRRCLDAGEQKQSLYLGPTQAQQSFSERGSAQTYTQPLPFALTLWLQPLPPSPLQAAFVYRFTAAKALEHPLSAKQSYAFSSLPPLLAAVDEQDSADSFRERLAAQIRVPVAELTLALLLPKHYELFEPHGVPAVAAASVTLTGAAAAGSEGAPPSRFEEWLAQGGPRAPRCNALLGLFDPTTPHTRSTSQNQLDAKALQGGKHAGGLTSSRSSNGLSIRQ